MTDIEQPSTKANTGGTATPIDQARGLDKEHVNRIIDFCISSSEVGTSEELKKYLNYPPDAQLAELIDQRFLQFREKLRNELLQEVEAQMDAKIRERVREEVTSFLKTLISRPIGAVQEAVL